MQSFLKKYYDQGLRKGVHQGIQQGMQQGLMQGEVQLLSRLLRKRFGELLEWAEQMLREASGGMLGRSTRASRAHPQCQQP